jgi:hypothetical protein
VLRSLLQKSSKFLFGKSGNMFGFQVLEERGCNVICFRFALLPFLILINISEIKFIFFSPPLHLHYPFQLNDQEFEIVLSFA